MHTVLVMNSSAIQSTFNCKDASNIWTVSEISSFQIHTLSSTFGQPIPAATQNMETSAWSNLPKLSGACCLKKVVPRIASGITELFFVWDFVNDEMKRLEGRR